MLDAEAASAIKLLCQELLYGLSNGFKPNGPGNRLAFEAASEKASPR